MREAAAAVLEDGRPTGPVDGAVDPSPAAHAAVGGVDDGVDVLGGDVALDDGHLGVTGHHATSLISLSVARSSAACRSSGVAKRRRVVLSIVRPRS
ncbi:hypothetical protein GCM10023340_12610 [Nocardioides marinquilinus]|uniref:Uncharacterized protein n=1 Tax=Nocardioides marinquilinus TaxID=1210400 RepID=A0ABP9PE28_9ACTN